jgi:hypothetical protein
MKKLRKLEGTPDFITVSANDDTENPGGAPNEYFICNGSESGHIVTIKYQNGVIETVGDKLVPNGILDECLLAILIDRYSNFQEGDFANEFTGRALEHVKGALKACNDRRDSRASRGVLNSYKK